MNYYNPNFYQSFQQPQQYYQPIPQQYQQSNIATGLNGKIVDSEEVVKATEVPIGGYGIFPKADLSEIYIKSWNSNGTTSVITYAPANPIEKDVIPLGDISTVLEKISNLEKKIDNILQEKEKVNANDY